MNNTFISTLKLRAKCKYETLKRTIFSMPMIYSRSSILISHDNQEKNAVQYIYEKWITWIFEVFYVSEKLHIYVIKHITCKSCLRKFLFLTKNEGDTYFLNF